MGKKIIPKKRKYTRSNTLKSPDEVQRRIDSYFKKIKEEEYTITGLALYIGMNDTSQLLSYQQKDDYYEIIKKAKLRIEHECEKRMLKRGKGCDIFVMKQFGRNDRPDMSLNINNGGDFNLSMILKKATEEQGDE